MTISGKNIIRGVLFCVVIFAVTGTWIESRSPEIHRLVKEATSWCSGK